MNNMTTPTIEQYNGQPVNTEIGTVPVDLRPSTRGIENVPVAPVVETENPETNKNVSPEVPLEDNTTNIDRDDIPKAEIKILGTNIPVSAGFIPLEGTEDFRINRVREKMAGLGIVD
ncbi:TPA: hypothetical protein DCP76_02425 [Patescibacteria group bacterium]|nr:hypothetical protein [Patescibacteria group bacterium]HAM96631.1 hypothetical protein [Patescibacteria group bacterium]